MMPSIRKSWQRSLCDHEDLNTLWSNRFALAAMGRTVGNPEVGNKRHCRKARGPRL
jgi:hypothetical protein